MDSTFNEPTIDKIADETDIQYHQRKQNRFVRFWMDLTISLTCFMLAMFTLVLIQWLAWNAPQWMMLNMGTAMQSHDSYVLSPLIWFPMSAVATGLTVLAVLHFPSDLPGERSPL